MYATMKDGLKKCNKCGGTGTVVDPVYVGGNMRKFRKDAGKSLRSVAKAMGLSVGYLSDLELGRRGWNTSLQKAFIRGVAKA